jgi:RNA polymerase sigma-70 factor (ECF subfamily)
MSLAVEMPPVQSGGPAPANCADLEALHREFYARLVRVCAHQLHDRSLAEDVAQDTILRALRFWSSYDAERPTWPWLKRIALHLCLDARRARSHEVCLDALPDRAEPTDRTERLIDEITVRRAMAGLPERQRLALRLRYFDDSDRDASAAALGVNVNAFDQLLNRARLRLAGVIEPVRAGASLGVVLIPLRWLRRRLPRQAAGGSGAATVAMGAMTTVPLALTPLLAIVAGMAPGGGEASYPAARTFAVPASHAKATPAKRVAPAGHDGGASHVSSTGTPPAAPSMATATVSKHPLGHGRVEGHRVQIVTPVSKITLDGYDDRDAKYDVLCKVPGVECSAR